MKIYKTRAHGKEYQVAELDTYYHAETNERVIEVLEQCRLNHTWIRIFQGDTKTGIVWPEEHDITGYIGRSTGPIKIPLLLHNNRSIGGGGLLDHCILKIRDNKGNVLYQADNFKQPDIAISGNDLDGCQLYYNGELHANCKTLKEAKKLKRKLEY